MNNAKAYPFPKDTEVKVELGLSGLIELRVATGSLGGDVALEHECEETEPGSEKHVVERGQPIDEEDLPREPVPVGKVQLGEHADHVLVEIVADHL